MTIKMPLMHAKQHGHGLAALTIIRGAMGVPSRAVRLQVTLKLELLVILTLAGKKESA